MGRDSVCAWVPAALVASPVSVTVMEKAEDALELTLFAELAAAACARCCLFLLTATYNSERPLNANYAKFRNAFRSSGDAFSRMR